MASLRVGLRLLSLVALLCLVAVVQGADPHGFKFLSDEEINKLDEKWAEEDGDEEDLPPWKRKDQQPPKPQLPPDFDPKNFDPKKLNLEELQGAQHAGKPKMFFLRFKSDSKEENQKLNKIYVEALRNIHLHVQAYMIEDDLGLYNLNDGKDLYKVTNFLKKQEGVVQIEVDSRKLMPEHEKDRKTKDKTDKEKAEYQAKKERIAKAQEKLKEARKKKAKAKKEKKQDEL